MDHTGFRQHNKRTTETMLEDVNAKHLNSQGQWLEYITGCDFSALRSTPSQARIVLLYIVLPPATTKCKLNGNRGHFSKQALQVLCNTDTYDVLANCW